MPDSTAAKPANAVALQPAPNKSPLVGGNRVLAIVPTDFEGAYRLATVIDKAKMAPKSLDSVEKITVAILHGMEVGLTPMAALQSIAVINGAPAIWGDGLLALVEASGLLEDREEFVEIDAKGEPSLAVCRVKRRGRERWIEHSFTQAEAMKAGLWNKAGPWQQYRRRMMLWRCRGWAYRDAFPDVLRGLHMAEELLDMVDVNPRPPEPTRAQFKAPATDVPEPQPADAAEPPAEPRQWAVFPTLPGQEPKREAILNLLTLARTPDEVDEIEAEHARFLGKIGRLEAETRKAFADRRAELGRGAAAMTDAPDIAAPEVQPETCLGLCCPACGSDATMVRDSRASAGSIRRRRRCEQCRHRFSTREYIVTHHDLQDALALWEEWARVPEPLQKLLHAMIRQIGGTG